MGAWLVCVVWWSVQVVTDSSIGRTGVGSVCVCGTVVECGFGCVWVDCGVVSWCNIRVACAVEWRVRVG